MDILQLTPADRAVLLGGPNDCIYVGPCRMSLGATKMVGAVYNPGTSSPGNPNGTAPHMDRSREYAVQEVIFEDLLTPSNDMVFPGKKQGTYDGCGRDVILVTYYKESKTLLGKALPHMKNFLPHLGKAVPKLEGTVPKLDGLLDTIGQDRELNRESWVVAVIGLSTGHVVTNTDYPFWRGKIKPEQKTTLARTISAVFDRRQDFIQHFTGNQQVEPDSDYA